VTHSDTGKYDPVFGRDVYAVQDNEGVISVLVVDDTGRLDWLTGSDNFTVIGGKRQA